MNIDASSISPPGGAISLSEPAFDLVMAVSSARQAMLPTVRLLKAAMNIEAGDHRPAARRALLGGNAGRAGKVRPKLARFFDPSDESHISSQTMNGSFTRAFQPMLNVSQLDLLLPDASVTGGEQME